MSDGIVCVGENTQKRKRQEPEKMKKKKHRRKSARPNKFQASILAAAKRMGLFVLIEKQGAAEVWRIYDAKQTGRQVTNYWPVLREWTSTTSHSRGYDVGPFEILRISKELILFSAPETPGFNYGAVMITV